MSLRDGIKKIVPDAIFLRLKFRRKMGRPLHLKSPKTFNEKLQWLKLHDHNPEYIKMVDKYEVKSYVAERIGEEYIIPTYGVWDSFDDIDFASLPAQFVLKCTHDSGGIVICTDKARLNIDEAREKLNRCMQRNYYWVGREWPYKEIKPQIIAEKYMANEYGCDLTDYKFYCFGGRPQYCQVIQERTEREKIDFYDMEWRFQNFTGMHIPGRPYPHGKRKEKPVQFENMKRIASILSNGIPFVRVDFYEVKDKLYFGEMTFYPLSGFGTFEPEDWNTILGNEIKLMLS